MGWDELGWIMSKHFVIERDEDSVLRNERAEWGSVTRDLHMRERERKRAYEQKKRGWKILKP